MELILFFLCLCVCVCVLCVYVKKRVSELKKNKPQSTLCQMVVSTLKEIQGDYGARKDGLHVLFWGGGLGRPLGGSIV